MESASAGSANKTPTVLFEDEILLVLDKPSGLVVHADGRTEERSLVDWLRERNPELEDVGGQHTLDSGRYVPRFGLLHRLDRDTSGVILIAKNTDVFHIFQRQFLDRSIEKTYVAFVKGAPPSVQGVIDAPIGRSREDFRQWTVPPHARGTLRKAITEYRLLASKGEFSELELTPKTGRTHQIRVHLKSIGCLILKDTRYGGSEGLGFARLALHAWKIAITDLEGKRREFVSPLPPDFMSAESLLKG